VPKPEGMALSSSPKGLQTIAANVAKCETRRPKTTKGHEKQLDPRRSAGHTTPNNLGPKTTNGPPNNLGPKTTNGHEKQLDPRRSAGHTTPNNCRTSLEWE
jgi:hypothetical protein